MRMWGVVGLAAVVALAGGCGGPPAKPAGVASAPMSTDGPNQVVVGVPGMH